jgi:hypothetical protein
MPRQIRYRRHSHRGYNSAALFKKYLTNHANLPISGIFACCQPLVKNPKKSKPAFYKAKKVFTLPVILARLLLLKVFIKYTN